MARTPDFNQFGDDLWEIANVFRDDALHATERLETFSLFLFLKLCDEMELEEEEISGKQVKDSEALIPQRYRFHRWAPDPDGYAKEQGCEDSIDFCKQMFTALATLKSKHPTARDVQRLFKDTVFRLRYTTTIRALVSRLQDLNLREIMARGIGEKGERFDIFGRAYEYLLQRFGQNKEFAEYFTPRHIVDRMVQIVDPEIGETTYDPACGTGGFIVRAFEHVRGKIARKRNAAERERLFRVLKEKHLVGVEHVPLVFKLALMNMILHQDGSSRLENADSLSNRAQDLHKAQYEVILANPPFGPTKQERLAQFEYHIRLYEALFLQHMMNALRPGGRAAVVVKEGLLFDSKKMLRSVCRRLVEQFQVLAVLSLPNGVFNPYSGAKTSIVVFRRPLGRDDARTESVWFYRVESDGRDLGATRRPLPDFDTDGDLQQLVALWPYTWRHEAGGGVTAVAKSDRPQDFESDKSWWATADAIRSADYNLTAGRYSPRAATTIEHEKPEVLINRMLELEEEIKIDLQDLLTLIAVPTSVEGLKGSVQFDVAGGQE